MSGDEAELGGEVLDDHREDVRGHKDPHEQVPVACARGDVGGDVSGVDIGDGRDEGGAEEGDELVVVLGVRAGHGKSSLLTEILRLPETLLGLFTTWGGRVAHGTRMWPGFHPRGRGEFADRCTDPVV